MLVETVERAVAELTSPGAGIVVAVSGGVDSTVLLQALAEVAGDRGLSLTVGHVHHGLRAAAADADADAVREAARRLDLPFQLERVAPAALRTGRANRARPTLQKAARTLRYAALRRMAAAAHAHHVATAHTLDDQAETVLLRLLRGASPDGLGGIPERSPDGVVIRPLLAVPRAEVEAFAAERGLTWREDASNDCDAYTRNRLRRHWLPGLARDFNPQLLRAIGRLAEAQRRDAEWIESLVEDVVERMARADDADACSLRIRADGWRDLPEALARRVVRALLVRAGAGRDVTRTHITRMLDFLRTDPSSRRPRRLELPGGLCVETSADGFALRGLRS